ncbi:MAG: lipopolysaccharide biosynthesis protein [Desulfobacterales bacterium]|nr:lipopolysaccharide biosynthesis protein [Desulfobacterales bacterium]
MTAKKNLSGWHPSARIGDILAVKGEIIWVLTGQLITFTGGIAGVKVLTNVMGPENYGQLGLGLTISGLVNLFFFGPFGQAIVRFFSICREKATLPAYFKAVFRMQKHTSLVLLVVSVPAAGATYLKSGPGWAWLIVISLLFGYFSGVNNSFLSFHNAIRQRRMVALHQGADMWLRMLAAMAVLLLANRSGSAALAGFCIGTAVVSLSWGYLTFNMKVVSQHCLSAGESVEDDFKTYREFFVYIRSFLYFSVFGAIVLYADRWILQAYHGQKEVGIYTALYLIANAPVVVIMNLAGQLMLPIIYDQAGDLKNPEYLQKSGKTVRLAVTAFGGGMLLLVLFAFFYGEPIVRLFSSEQYIAYASALWIILLGSCLFHIGQLLVMRGLSLARPNIYVLPKAVHAMIFLITTGWLVQRQGPRGAAIAMALSASVYLLLVGIANRRLEKAISGCLDKR